MNITGVLDQLLYEVEIDGNPYIMNMGHGVRLYMEAPNADPADVEATLLAVVASEGFILNTKPNTGFKYADGYGSIGLSVSYTWVFNQLALNFLNAATSNVLDMGACTITLTPNEDDTVLNVAAYYESDGGLVLYEPTVTGIAAIRGYPNTPVFDEYGATLYKDPV